MSSNLVRGWSPACAICCTRNAAERLNLLHVGVPEDSRWPHIPIQTCGARVNFQIYNTFLTALLTAAREGISSNSPSNAPITFLTYTGCCEEQLMRGNLSQWTSSQSVPSQSSKRESIITAQACQRMIYIFNLVHWGETPYGSQRTSFEPAVQITN